MKTAQIVQNAANQPLVLQRIVQATVSDIDRVKVQP